MEFSEALARTSVNRVTISANLTPYSLQLCVIEEKSRLLTVEWL